MRLDTLEDVFVEQIADLYSAEQQLVQALPKMITAAHSDELRKAFEEHFEQTQGHVTRLQEVMNHAPKTVPTETCKAMQGLIREGEEIIGAQGDGAALDAALIAAAQRVEHYEIAGYGTARTLADQLGYGDAEKLLDQTLDEEANADKLLTKLATGGIFRSGINEEAADKNGG
jgi:ferritin-like metal-binding protein YciE